MQRTGLRPTADRPNRLPGEDKDGDAHSTTGQWMGR